MLWLSSDFVQFPFGACDQLALSLLLFSLSPLLSPSLPVSLTGEPDYTKQMNVFRLAICHWFWEVISFNTVIVLFIFVAFCSLLHLKTVLPGVAAAEFFKIYFLCCLVLAQLLYVAFWFFVASNLPISGPT